MKNYNLFDVVFIFIMIFSLSCSKDSKMPGNEGPKPPPVSKKPAPVKVAITSIPDPKFEEALRTLKLDGTGNTNDGKVLTSKINTVTSLNVSDKGISDLTGIEGFTKLTVLDCSKNKFTSLDLSKNVALTDLSCHSNFQLTSLDLSKNVALTKLNCVFNHQLITINLKNGKSSTLKKSQLYIAYNPKLTCVIVDDKDHSNWRLSALSAKVVENEADCN